MGHVGQAAAPAPTPPVVPASAPVPKVIKVLKTDAKYRGARAAWYEVLRQHDGRTVKEYTEATTAKPPSVPKSGRVENPAGWVSYFVRTGVAQVG